VNASDSGPAQRGAVPLSSHTALLKFLSAATEIQLTDDQGLEPYRQMRLYCRDSACDGKQQKDRRRVMIRKLLESSDPPAFASIDPRFEKSGHAFSEEWVDLQMGHTESRD